MINFSKKTLFFLMLICVIAGGLLSGFSNFTVLDSGHTFTEIWNELGTSFIFLGAAFVFMLTYVKKIKTTRHDTNT